MVKKIILWTMLSVLSAGLFGQKLQDSTFVRPGMVRFFGCFAFDYRMNQSVWDYRLHGFMEYFAEKNISFMGEVYQYLDSGTDFPVIYRNFSVGTGLGYHWPRKNFDPYIFYMAIGNFYESQVKSGSTIVRDKFSTEASPGMAIGAGANLYVWKYLNFFLQLRYHHTFIYSPIQIKNMDAFSVSYGLGFNFHTKKKK